MSPKSASKNQRVAPACAFVIFGVTGDLTARKLMPSLYQLHLHGQLSPETVIVGHARSDLTDDGLRDAMAAAVKEASDDFDDAAWATLAPRLHYVQGDYKSPEGFEKLAKLLVELDLKEHVYYTATPPSAYDSIARGLSEAGLAKPAAGKAARLVVEKPFGYDLASAEKLNNELLSYFDEKQIFRIDHYLAKETAQNLAMLRFANTIFEPLWDNRFIDHVEISVLESLGMEGRGAFYEGAGVIRDVFQNHLLQLLAMVAMEPPVKFDATNVRNEKVKLFSAVSCPDPSKVVLGQYVSGNGFPGYRHEPHVDPESNQATFVAAQLEIKNWRWAGVPFYLRTGKRLQSKVSEIVLQFKTPPYVPFELDKPVTPDRLVLRIAPDEGIALAFNGKEPGQRLALHRISLDFSYQRAFDGPIPEAYETVLLDAMEGDATLFMRADEVEAQWRIVEPILKSSSALHHAQSASVASRSAKGRCYPRAW